MCHVIVTCRSMLWTLLSIVVAFAELVAFMSPEWLLRPPLPENGVTQTKVNDRESLGLYNRCYRIKGEISCGIYARAFGEVASKFWQAAMLFLAAGMLVLGCVACISVFTLCFQSIKKKSIFNICGLLQAIGGKDVLVLLNGGNLEKCSSCLSACSLAVLSKRWSWTATLQVSILWHTLILLFIYLQPLLTFLQ
uniref:Uncharacterized protein n=1 Tax=Xiphophorus couchianus TaxID=32473 RepID=A0A3B5LWS7_9TELE